MRDIKELKEWMKKNHPKAKYIAMDSNGSWWCYRDKPVMDDHGLPDALAWSDHGDALSSLSDDYINEFLDCQDWKESLFDLSTIEQEDCVKKTDISELKRWVAKNYPEYRFLAKDENGFWYLYEDKPVKIDYYWYPSGLAPVVRRRFKLQPLPEDETYRIPFALRCASWETSLIDLQEEKEMNKETKKFWAVWRVNGHIPTFCHETEASALSEAQRLSKQHPGSDFYVLESTFHVKVKPSPEVTKL